MKDLKKIIDEVKSLKDANFKPSDDAILISATNILVSIGNQKPTTNKKPGEKIVIKNPTDPATAKQKYRLDELKVEYPEELTKGEAHQLISENANKEPSSK